MKDIILEYPKNVNIDSYKIIKFISSGMYGMIYLAKKSSKEYAIKIEHMFPEEIVENYTCPIWREIYFCKTFGNNYPDLFVHLYGYDILQNYNYNHKYKIDIKFTSAKDQEFYKKLHSSNTCIRKIYSLIDNNYNNFIQINSMPQNMIYSMIVQILSSMILLHENEYIHGDIHLGNIGIVKTSKKNITIGKLSIPTFGYIYKLIDYGKTLNKINIANRIDFKHMVNNDVNLFINLLYSTNISAYIIDKNIELNEFDKSFEYIKTLPEFIEIQKNENRNGIQLNQFIVKYPEKYQSIVYKESNTKHIKIINTVALSEDLNIVEYLLDYIFISPELTIKPINNNNITKLIKNIIQKVDKKISYNKELMFSKTLLRYFYDKL